MENQTPPKPYTKPLTAKDGVNPENLEKTEIAQLPKYWGGLCDLVNKRLRDKAYLSGEQVDDLCTYYAAIQKYSQKGRYQIPDYANWGHATDILKQRGYIKSRMNENNSGSLFGVNIDICVHKSQQFNVTEEQKNALYDFIEFCAQEIPVQGSIKIYLEPKIVRDDITTGGFNLEDKSIKTRWEGRALIDVIRTIAHELVHYGQLERGEFERPDYVHQDIGGPIEDEANALAGVLIKRFVKEKNARYIHML